MSASDFEGEIFDGPFEGTVDEPAAPEPPIPAACPTCGNGEVIAAGRLPPGTWSCQRCGAVWRKRRERKDGAR